MTKLTVADPAGNFGRLAHVADDGTRTLSRLMLIKLLVFVFDLGLLEARDVANRMLDDVGAMTVRRKVVDDARVWAAKLTDDEVVTLWTQRTAAPVSMPGYCDCPECTALTSPEPGHGFVRSGHPAYPDCGYCGQEYGHSLHSENHIPECSCEYCAPF